MEPGILAWLGFGWWSLGSAIQWASAALARSPRRAVSASHQASDFSIVAPMAGAEDASAAYVYVLRQLAEAGAEVLICVAHAGDGAVARTRKLWPEAPILVGNDDTFNPKMNNVRKGLEAASRGVVALCSRRRKRRRVLRPRSSALTSTATRRSSSLRRIGWALPLHRVASRS